MSDIRTFDLPDLGEGLEEGDVVEWLVEVGDTVELNQEIVTVETAKATVDIPVPFAGTLVERAGEPGDTLTVGEMLCRIDVGATEATEATTGSTGLDAEEEPQPLVGYGSSGDDSGRRRRRRTTPATADAQQSTAVERDGPPLAKPPVRKLAKEKGLDLSLVPGTGRDGSITREDLAQYEAQLGSPTAPTPPPPAPGTPAQPDRSAQPQLHATGGEKPVPGFRGRRPGEVEEVTGVRKRIVAKMEQSRRDIPHALCARDADLTAMWALRHDLTAQARAEGFDVTITPNAMIMRATVLALRRFPTLNAVYDADAGEIRLHEHVNLGVAVDTDRGLLVPNVKDAHTKSLLQLALEADELAARCRDGSVTPAELTGGTFTTDNYGAFGNDDGNPIINAPEAGILGIGFARERPWVVDGEIRVRRVARFQLAFDHRVCDGGEAGRFVTYVADLCEQPARILLHA